MSEPSSSKDVLKLLEKVIAVSNLDPEFDKHFAPPYHPNDSTNNGAVPIEEYKIKIIQDAQEAAGNRMYVKALDDVLYELPYLLSDEDFEICKNWIMDHKAKFIEEVTKKS